MGGENFTGDLNKKIDTAIDQVVGDTNEAEKQLVEKADQLRDKLKQAITSQHTEDEQIKAEEWTEIFESLPKDLLKDFEIYDVNGLKFFILLKPFFQ
ncbi:hypothetical protein HZA38_04275 [Candidatus Peregrinibacteria bacterium]|nr:hypothetical protein [Candidatus Peregrinibacteria bacterium]